jgi:DNA-binding transcriptional ArsR family regulator
MLDEIIPSKTRRKILSLFLNNVDEAYHLRRIGREVGEEINAVKRELDILEKAKILKKEKRLNKSIYVINKKHLYFDELLKLQAKHSTLATGLRKNSSLLGKVHFIAMSLRLQKKETIPESDVYMVFVGTVVAAETQKLLYCMVLKSFESLLMFHQSC